MRRLDEYIMRNIHNKITISALARVTNLSPWHLVRWFRSEFGVTPMRYVMLQRVDEAVITLRETILPLIDVALDCGFASQSHMTDVFKRAGKLPPAQYRKRS